MEQIIFISEIFINQIKADANEIINETVKENETETSPNERPKASSEGRAVAYVSLVLMALLPIVIGSFKSVKAHQDQKEKCLVSGEKPEAMTRKDAAMFPFIASGALLGLYIFFKIFSKEYINLLLTGYFFVLGVLALADVMLPLLIKYLPSVFPVIPFHLLFTKGNVNNGEYLIDIEFDTRYIFSHFLASLFGVWYLWSKHWMANNIFGLAFAIKGVELLHLNTVLTGCILLGGLFIYDIFWVFGTDVMVTVAKSFEAPIKLIFPQDFLEKGFYGTNFAMLGLGDIVIPGIFLALLLRFDNSLNRKSYFYFYTSFLAYFLGLVLTIAIMTIYNHAQPALLYLVPFCISFPVFTALIRGDLKAMFSYEDHTETEGETTTTAAAKEVVDEKKKSVKAE